MFSNVASKSIFVVFDQVRQAPAFEYLGLVNGLKILYVWEIILSNNHLTIYTLQEMCCGFLLSREMWYRKSVLPGTGAG